MNTLITIAGVLIFSAVALILLTLEALVSFLILSVNWSLVFVIALALLVIWSILKRSKLQHDEKSL